MEADRWEKVLMQTARADPGAIHLGLERIETLLRGLAEPQRGLTFVHVAGTNGKGSTIAFLEAIFQAAGYQPGVYTSPHLERFNERIRVAGAMVDDATLSMLVPRLLAAEGAEQATCFELTTALALLFFAQEWEKRRQDPFWCRPILWETGLGGRLDATNVVQSVMSLITAIDLEHTAFLGATIPEIAWEKAGILKAGVPAVVDPILPAACRVVRQRALELETPLRMRGEEYHLTRLADGYWQFRDPAGELRLPPPALPGWHQYHNAALAVAAVRWLQQSGWAIPEEALAEGVRRAHWPGRLEYFPGSPAIWLDGAHNPAAIAALSRHLAEMESAPTTLLFTALKDKDVEEMVRSLAPQVDAVWTVTLDNVRGRDGETLAELWRQAGKKAVACDRLTGALEQIRAATPPEGRIVVTGSLYLIGAVRPLLMGSGAKPQS